MTDIAVLQEMMRTLRHDYKMILERERTSLIEDYIFELDISGLQISWVPEELQELSFLEELDLSYNLITQLPEFLLDMDNLRKIYLFDNPLTELPSYLEPIADKIEIEPDKHLPGHAVLVDLTTSDTRINRATQTQTHFVERNTEKRREIQPSSDPDHRSYYFKLSSRLELEQVKYLLDAYRERTCCKLSGRMRDQYCMLCGRIIPEAFKVKQQH